MRVSRRALVGGGAAAIGLAAFGGYRVLGPGMDREGTIANFIARQVPQVSAGDSCVTTFAREVMGMVEKRFRWNLDMHMSLIANPLLQRALDDEQMVVQSDLERMLVTTFLRSTDLLLAPASGGPVNYIAIADPYVAGCSNPLANFS